MLRSAANRWIWAPALLVSLGSMAPLAAWAEGEIPIRGRAADALKPIDAIVLEVMRDDEIPGLSLAVARGGKLGLARGYGWADVENKEPVLPGTMFGLASVSKSITAATILKLVEQGKLKLDDHAFALLGELEPLPGDKPDPRLAEITVRQLLYHEGGWDRGKSGEPRELGPKLAKEKGRPTPRTNDELIQIIMCQPLDFAPGTDAIYSNFGYAILGSIIEHETNQPYADAVRELTLMPMGIHQKDIRLNVLFGWPRPARMARRYGPQGRLIERDGHWAFAMASGGGVGSRPRSR